MKNLRINLIIVALLSIVSTVSAQNKREQVTDSLKNILQLAKEGNPEAQNEVGLWYYLGRHTDQDYEMALQWWAKAAQQGNVEAIGNMGLCYQTGHGVEKDSLMAIKLYQSSIKKGNKELFNRNVELAEQGSVFSNMLIASCYDKEIGVKRSLKDAVPFLKRAAEKGSVLGQRDLALAYLNLKQPKEAYPWFKKGAEAGDLTCMFYSGKMLLEGTGVTENKQEGANILLKTARSGFPQAMYLVGKCYMDGDGLTKNEEQAVKWYKLSAGKDAIRAKWALAQCYREGKGTEINYEQALYWYADASNNGYKKSFEKLINDSIPDSPFAAYVKGMKALNDKKFDDALKQFKIVEKAKISYGKLMNAVILLDPAYAKNNAKKGAKILKEISKTNPQALYILAGLYESGNGVDKNMKDAIDCLVKSCEMDYAPAECALGDIYFEGRGVDQSFEKAIELYTKAYEQGELTENAANRLADCYEEGKGGVEVNKEKAENIRKSFKKVNFETLYNLI